MGLLAMFVMPHTMVGERAKCGALVKNIGFGVFSSRFKSIFHILPAV
jgi:hypothetical protein